MRQICIACSAHAHVINTTLTHVHVFAYRYMYIKNLPTCIYRQDALCF